MGECAEGGGEGLRLGRRLVRGGRGTRRAGTLTTSFEGAVSSQLSCKRSATRRREDPGPCGRWLARSADGRHDMEQATTQRAQTAEHKRLATPDETREFERGRLEIVEIGGGSVGRLTLQAGWRWSEHVKPIAGTELCAAPHFQYHVTGNPSHRHGRRQRSSRPSRVTSPRCPAGHDAWVVGDAPVVVIDWQGDQHVRNHLSGDAAARATVTTPPYAWSRWERGGRAAATTPGGRTGRVR